MGSKRGNDNAAKRPGIFIPFSFRRTLKYLNADQKACLLDAVLTYGEDGIEPEYSGPDAVGFMVAFEQLREKIDYDGKHTLIEFVKTEETAIFQRGRLMPQKMV